MKTLYILIFWLSLITAFSFCFVFDLRAKIKILEQTIDLTNKEIISLLIEIDMLKAKIEVLSEKIIPLARVAPPRFKRAHAYHGILTSRCEDGEWVFYRNNQRCKLFAYLEK